MTATSQKVTTFSRRGQNATNGLAEFAAKLAECPDDAGVWLVMADWLSDQGYDRPAALLRSLWMDGMPETDGEITRGFWQYENGSRHWEGVTVECKGGQWYHCYWSNGNFRSEIDREAARRIVASRGKPYRHTRIEKWTGEKIVSEGVEAFTGLTVSAD